MWTQRILLSALLSTSAWARPIVSQKRQSSIPQYVLDYAPLVWLDPQERYLPSDVSAQLTNTHPTLNETSIAGAPSPLTLDNLEILNTMGDTNVYLTGDDDWTANPAWVQGVLPDGSGKTDGAISCTVVVHDKGDGVLDAFYFYFYAYNQGDTVLGNELGDHLGDWEHTMVRFDSNAGTPSQIWLSQHDDGDAFTYNAIEKQGDRPVVYSARGTHANYATSGTHDHTIPDVPLSVGLLMDYTGQGTLWDPIQSAYLYSVTFPSGAGADDSSLPEFASDDGSPTDWLYFDGRWGDMQFPDSDKRQSSFFGQKKYVSGPTGPRDKQLNRSQVCPANGILCIVRDDLPPGS